MPVLAIAWTSLCAALKSIRIGAAALLYAGCVLAGAAAAETFEHAFRLRLPFVTLEGLGPRLADIRAADAAALAAAKAHVASVHAAQSRATAGVIAAYTSTSAQTAARFRTLNQEIPAYVTAKDNSACTINAGAVRLLDGATGGVPGLSLAPGLADDAPSGVALATVVATDIDNDQAAELNAEQLSALQAWIRAQAAAWTASPPASPAATAPAPRAEP